MKMQSHRSLLSSHKVSKYSVLSVLHLHPSLYNSPLLAGLRLKSSSPSPVNSSPASTTLDDLSCYLPSNGTHDVDILLSDKILTILTIIGRQSIDSSQENFKNKILTTQHRNDLEMACSEISRSLKQIRKLSTLLCNPDLDTGILGNSSGMDFNK